METNSDEDEIINKNNIKQNGHFASSRHLDKNRQLPYSMN